MAKRAVCDVCGNSEPLDELYSSIPERWFSLRQKFNDEQHLCSLGCLQRAVEQRRECPEPIPAPATTEVWHDDD